MADAIDAQLHAERVDPDTRTQRRHSARLDTLPDGAFVLHEGEPWLALRGELLRWTPAGYTDHVPRPAAETPSGEAVVLTPPSLLATLRAGWEPLVPLLHPSTR